MSHRHLAVILASVLLVSSALAGAEVKLTALTLQSGKTVDDQFRQDIPGPLPRGHAGDPPL